MNKALQYYEPDEVTKIKSVTIHPNAAIQQMRNYAYQHGYSYSNDDEALDDFINVNWAKWVEVKG